MFLQMYGMPSPIYLLHDGDLKNPASRDPNCPFDDREQAIINPTLKSGVYFPILILLLSPAADRAALVHSPPCVAAVSHTPSWHCSPHSVLFRWCIAGIIIISINVKLKCLHPQCIDQLTVVQAELQDSVKELTKSRKKYQEAETMAQAVREKAELDAKYGPKYSTVNIRIDWCYPELNGRCCTRNITFQLRLYFIKEIVPINRQLFVSANKFYTQLELKRFAKLQSNSFDD